jgi:cytochrome c peroxidase
LRPHLSPLRASLLCRAAVIALMLVAHATPGLAQSSADRAALAARAQALFPALPPEAANPDNPVTPAKVTLGKMLYFDTRLSKNRDVSCNSCHALDAFGVDGEATSPGHRGQRGDRNSPTVYNAAIHISQFWDGRAADVEEQAKGPVLNPVEMAMPSEEAVVAVLRSIPGYAAPFAEAFPGEAEPITYDNMARAIGAFERRLLTPAPIDRFAAGQLDALDEAQLRGLQTFLDVGCTTCHIGPAIGGGMYQKLGLVKPYPTEDIGLGKLTGQEADNFFFKVPSLRNTAETGPWFHDGSVASLDQAVQKMAEYQLGRTLDKQQTDDVVAFLGALTGEIPTALIVAPTLPEDGPETPAADPS